MLIWNRVEEEAGLEELEILGTPEALDSELLFEYNFALTVFLVREGISVLAQAAGKDLEELLEASAEDAR